MRVECQDSLSSNPACEPDSQLYILVCTFVVKQYKGKLGAGEYSRPESKTMYSQDDAGEAGIQLCLYCLEPADADLFASEPCWWVPLNLSVCLTALLTIHICSNS